MHRVALVSITAALLASCESGTGPRPLPAPAAVEAVSGNGQSAPAGTLLPDPVVVRVTDEDGELLDGGVVVFRVIAGGGTVGEGTARTGADGMAGEHWTLGTTAGEQRLEARVLDAGGTPLVADTFTATATPAAPSQITITGGHGQSGAPGQPLPAWLGVRLRDPYGNAVPGWTVEWAVLAGGGTVQPATSVTDTNGEARTQWVMGPGDGSVRASAQGVPPVTFSGTQTPVATAIRVFSGNAQEGPAGGAPPYPLVVRVLDGAGRPLPAAGVHWQVAAGGGTLHNAQTATDSSGLASAQWVLGLHIGPENVVLAGLENGGSPVTFTANAELPPSATLSILSGSGQTGRALRTLPQPAVVEVRTAGGLPVSGATVTWTVPSGGAVTPAISFTDSAGRGHTSWTLGTLLGTQRLTARAGTHSEAFLATVTPSTVVQIVGDSVTLETGQAIQVRFNIDGPDAHPRVDKSVLDSSVVGVHIYGYGGVLARKPGTTVYVVRAGDGGDSMVVRVRPMPRRFVALTSGGYTSCGLTTATDAQRLYCWGNPVTGSIASGNTPFTAPVQISQSRHYDWVAMGEKICGGVENGPVYCWPQGYSGSHSPTRVPGDHSWRTIDPGGGHSCGITADGNAWCFGGGSWGQLGNGSTVDTRTPVLVSGNLRWSKITVGYIHSCGIATSGAAYCWGGSTSPRVSTPVAVAGGHVFTSIEAGESVTCGLDPQGVAWCWGPPFGQVPTEVPGMTFTDLSVLSAYFRPLRICGVGTDTRVYCWTPAAGALGPGAPVPTTLRFRHVEPLIDSNCGITNDNLVYCWGSNAYGQLGQGDLLSRTEPARVVGQP
jgi:hypothetical protein